MSYTTNNRTMPDTQPHPCTSGAELQTIDGPSEIRRQLALLKTGALQNAILHSANFSIIATDEKGIIQLFNVGAERMLGYTAAELVITIKPSDMQARADTLSATDGIRSDTPDREPERKHRPDPPGRLVPAGRKGLEAGFFSYLTKPIRVEAFMDAMDLALDSSKVAPDNDAQQKALQ